MTAMEVTLKTTTHTNSDNSASFRNNMSVTMMARLMALMGCATNIICLETGLTQKQIRRIHKDLQAEGYEISKNTKSISTKSRSSSIRSSSTILSNQAVRIQASLLMLTYERVGGPGIYRSIDMNALCKAFRIYSAIRKELPVASNPRWAPLNISDAWCLAHEIRAGRAFLSKCRSCDNHYFESELEKPSMNPCPFCSS